MSNENENKKTRRRGIYGASIDKDQFEKLCAILCTDQEILSILKTSKVTLNSFCLQNYGISYKDTYLMFASQGKASLRRAQFEMSQKNAVMAIWLGKQWLNQTDKIENTTQEKIEIINDLKGVKNES